MVNKCRDGTAYIFWGVKENVVQFSLVANRER